ncbi:MAG: hypothetical protein II008_08275 [Oscillospiraceae bacterium]|nr:hypothetical protein [Oscillospiraceae bacterium]
MFEFLASLTVIVWIQKHPALTICILVSVIAIIIALHNRRKARIQAYLALPVQFIGNKSTKVFHCLNCSQLSNVAPINRIAFRLPDETVRAGYRPCGICSPRWPSE